ncbi:MAG: thermonuclease family protein [Ancalomicrobiaceae bacterium]|nr:thermonuclease family protein [Ancalomicrobiaceae bacterium]
MMRLRPAPVATTLALRRRGDGPPMSGWTRVAPLIAAALFGPPPSPAAAETIDACALPAGATVAAEPAAVAVILSGDTLSLGDGRVVRLAGISTPRMHDDAPASGEPEAADFTALAKQTLADIVAGHQIKLYPVSAEPDRHGRIRARLTRADDGLWLEAELVARGLTRVEPGPDDYACARHLEAIEAQARQAKRGVWADPRFQVLSATDPHLDRWIGRYVLIEGTVVSTGQSGSRHYLNFGTDFRRDFAVQLDDKVSAGGRRDRKHPGRFAVEGFLSKESVGRILRVRGVLTLGGGGLIRPSVPEEIEWLSTKP